MLLPPTLLPVFCDDNMVLIGHSASGKRQEQNVKRGIFSEPLKDCIAQKWLRILRFEEKSIRTVLVAVCNVQGDWTEKFKVKEWRNVMLWKVWILLRTFWKAYNAPPSFSSETVPLPYVASCDVALNISYSCKFWQPEILLPRIFT